MCHGMAFKITFTSKRRAAFTLVEFMVASVLTIIVLGAVLSFFLFSSRSFVALNNYVDLDQQTQLALDKMSREIRQVNMLTSYSPTNNLTFQDYDGATLQYVYSPTARTLTRTKGGVNQTLLTGCDSIQFAVFQRTPSNDTFLPWTTTAVTNTKVVELTWNCSRTIMGSKVNTESMQSAKVVIRKK